MTVWPEIRLEPGTIGIADLHLDLGDPALAEPFVGWLARLRGVPRLVVLGDLFDVWVGPGGARSPGAPRVLDALRALVRGGTSVALVPGNRDFLLDRHFAERTDVELFPEGFVGLHGAARTLFVHGDTLCTRDHGYQRLRRVLRSRPVAWVAPRIPLALGAAIARRLRRASIQRVAAKPAHEKAIQPSAVAEATRRGRATGLVCGHAHAFRDEVLTDGTRWIVLDAFGGQRDLFVVGSDGTLAVRSSRL